MKKIKYLATIIVILVCCTLAGCKKTGKDLEKAIDSHNHAEAIEIMQDLTGNTADINQAAAYLNAKVKEAVAEYGRGSISYEEAKNDCDTVQRVIDAYPGEFGYDLRQDAYNASDTLLAIYDSKSSYEEAVELLDDGQYESAMTEFDKVISADTEHYSDAGDKYSEAERLLVQATVNEIDDFIETHDYDGAENSLRNGVLEWYDYDAYEQCEKKIENARIQDDVDEADSLMNEGKFSEAIVMLEKCFDKYGISESEESSTDKDSAEKDLKESYATAVRSYKKQVLEKSDAYAAQGDIDSAISVLLTAQEIVGPDEEIEKQIVALRRTVIKTKVSEYESSNDYEGAITYMYENMDIIGTDADILFELSTCEQNFRSEIIAEAEAAFAEEGYQAAVAVVNKGLQVMHDDEELLKYKDKYVNSAPVKLSSLTPYTSVGRMYAQPCTDNMGNRYEDCILKHLQHFLWEGNILCLPVHWRCRR